MGETVAAAYEGAAAGDAAAVVVETVAAAGDVAVSDLVVEPTAEKVVHAAEDKNLQKLKVETKASWAVAYLDQTQKSEEPLFGFLCSL